MRFLLIDDDPEYRRLLRYHLEVEWPEAAIDEHQPSCAGRGPDAVSLDGVDALLLGHPLDGESGFSWLDALRRRDGCPPVLVFAEPSDEFLAVDALKSGASSYFPKRKVTHARLVSALHAELDPCVSDERPPAAPGPFRGTRRHRFLEQLHATDLSTVYLAEDEDTGERVACKVVEHAPDPAGGRLFDRFLLEYEVIATVRHPHVVRIFDLGVADDHAYIVMEYFSAGSLAARLGAPLDPRRAIEYTRQIASALAAIHAAGILHRDLKPANVMFRPDDTLALIDFGLAKQLRLQAAITGTGQIFGTPYYMSPEQGHAEPADERSDLYALGCMLYEMLTGEKPFVASTAMGVIYKHAHAPRPKLGADLAELQPLLERLLAVDAAERWQSAGEVLRALEALG